MTKTNQVNWKQLLYKAWNSYCKKKRRNSEEESISNFESFAKANKKRLAVIKRHLDREDYHFGKWKATLIPKNDGSNRLLIIPSNINDKLVLKAISDYLSGLLADIFDSVSSISYAYQKGKSSREALLQLKRMHNPENVLLKIDIRHFFDEIDKSILIQLLDQYSIDRYVKELICSGINPNVDYSCLEKSDADKFPQSGIPQGISISAVLSNLYLYDLDKLAVSENWKMVRYADDMVLSVSNREEALLLLSQIENFLCEERKLTIHPLQDSSDAKTAIFQNPKKKQMKYLGVIFNGKDLYPTNECCCLLINKIKSICKNTSSCKEKSINSSIAQWCGYYAFTDVPNGKIKSMNRAINYQINKYGLNYKVDLTSVLLKTRRRQNSRLAKLIHPTRIGEEYEWLNIDWMCLNPWASFCEHDSLK